MRFLMLSIILWSALACTVGPAAAGHYTLVYSGNIDGELEPCGCTQEGDLGGLRRAATLVDHLRAEQPGLFQISGGGMMSGFAANGRLTNEIIIKGASMLNYDAVAVQWADLSYGADLPARYTLAWTVSTRRGQGFAKARRISRGGEELAFFSRLAPATAPDRGVQGGHAR